MPRAGRRGISELTAVVLMIVFVLIGGIVVWQFFMKSASAENAVHVFTMMPDKTSLPGGKVVVSVPIKVQNKADTTLYIKGFTLEITYKDGTSESALITVAGTTWDATGVTNANVTVSPPPQDANGILLGGKTQMDITFYIVSTIDKKPVSVTPKVILEDEEGNRFTVSGNTVKIP